MSRETLTCITISACIVRFSRNSSQERMHRGEHCFLFTSPVFTRRVLINLLWPATGQRSIRCRVQQAFQARFTKNELTVLNNNIIGRIARRISFNSGPGGLSII